jgi:hypothetical protein
MMTIDLFRQKLASVYEASSVKKGTKYSDIKIQDAVITFQRNEGSCECIAISDLYRIYSNEVTINTGILKTYIPGKTQSPAFAILVAAGLYDKFGNRINFEPVKPVKRILDFSIPLKRRLLLFLHFLPIIAVLIAIFQLSSDVSPFSIANLIIGGIILIVSGSFLFYVYNYKKDNIGENTYTSYFTLLIFTVGIFPFYNYVRDYQNSVKDKISYTAGFRAWGSQVEIFDIKVSYFDKFGIPG